MTENTTTDILKLQLSHPAGVPGSSAFLYIPERSSPNYSASDLKLRQKLNLKSNNSNNTTRNNSNNNTTTNTTSHNQNTQADVLGKILGWRQSKARYSEAGSSPSRHRSKKTSKRKSTIQQQHQQLPQIFRSQKSPPPPPLLNFQSNTTPIPISTSNIPRVPTLKKSLSSDQLILHYQDGSCFPRIDTSLHPTSLLDPPIELSNLDSSTPSWPPFSSQFLQPTHDNRLKNHRLSLPAMHAVLDPNRASYQNLNLDLSPPPPHHPTMHGVDSNESIRTAKPNTQSKPPSPLSQDQPLDSLERTTHPGPAYRRFQDPRVFDLFIHNPRPESTQPYRRFLSPDLLATSSSPSEASSTPSQPPSLGFSMNSSLNSSHLPSSNHSTTDLPSSMDPRFAIWAENPSSPPKQPAQTPYHQRKRSSVALEARHEMPHPASASTSNLGIDHSTGRLTHLITHHSSSHPSPTPISPLNMTNPKRWSRTGKTSTSSNHTTHDLPSSSSPNVYTTASTTNLGRSRDEFHSFPSSSDDHLPKQSTHSRILMAATIERWIAELTTQIDSLGLSEFFFTYRTIMKPNELAQLLASRFEWSIMFRSSVYAKCSPDWNTNVQTIDPHLEQVILSLDGRCLVLDQEGETLRRVAKVRTFVMIRHWLVHHFEDDFLYDTSLQTELHDWLENLTDKIKRVQRAIKLLDHHSSSESPRPKPQDRHQASFSGEDDLRILKTLRRILRKQQLTHQQSFHPAVPVPSDSTPQDSLDESAELPRSKHKPPKVDARELFNDPEPAKSSDHETSLKRPRRSLTAGLVDRDSKISSKGALGHGRYHSVGTLAQVRASNFSRSNLRLDEVQNDTTTSQEALGESENQNNPETTASKADEDLILKLKSIFECDTRRSRHQDVQSRDTNTDPNRSRYSFKQASSPLAKRDQNATIIHRHRASESISASSKPLSTPQQRTHLSHLPSSQYHQGALSFPQHHNPLQRYFTSTMGTIGRFKRMINNRSGPHMSSIPVVNNHHYSSTGGSGPASASVFPYETEFQQDPNNNEIGDLLCVKGNLERYLSFFEIHRDSSMSACNEEVIEEPEEEEDQDQDQNNQAVRNSKKSLLPNRSFEQESSDDLDPSSGYPTLQHDECLDSQLSLSSSVTNTTCTTLSIPSETDGELQPNASGDDLVVVSTDSFDEPDQITKSGPNPDEHLLHGSMSIETIKSESHPLTISGGGMGLLKKQLRKKFTNKDMCPVLMRASMDESFSGTIPEHKSPGIRYSEDSPRMGQLSLGVPSPNHGEMRPISIQLDDLDALDSEEESPAGGQKLRRFPGTTDLKQAIAIGRKSLFNLKGGLLKTHEDRSRRFSSETSSSIGTRRVPSIAGSIFRRSKLSHRSSTPLASPSLVSSIQQSRVPEMDENESENGTGAVVANFVADGLESDEDEPGDVEAALRRLEGVIDANREKEKARRVEIQMMKSIEASRRTRPFSPATHLRASYTSQTDETDELETCSESAHEDDGSENSSDADDDHRHKDDHEDDTQDLELELGERNPEDQTNEDDLSLVVGDTQQLMIAKNPGRTPPRSSSKSLHDPGTKSHIRFFTSNQPKKFSIHQPNDSKIFRAQQRKIESSLAVDQGMPHKGSLHKLFSVNNEPSTPLGSNNDRLNRQSNSLGPSPAEQPQIRKLPHPSVLPPLPPVHRSFLLDCRTEILAQQFCLIERDLLRNITWQELLLSKWQENRSGSRQDGQKKAGSRATVGEEVIVTCWESFMKQRAKDKMKLKGRIQSHNNLHLSSAASSPENTHPISSPLIGGTEIHALIMRFNLTCNWVASELVLTFNLDERVALLGKFIRLAFKCYRQNNFQTLTQIIHGLQTPYVERLKKTWSKLGIWESRMFRDLKEFTSHLSNFKSLRNVQDSLIDESSAHFSQPPLANPGLHTNGSRNPATYLPDGPHPRSSHSYSRADTTACIPFLGLYLRDLTINDELPTYLDPTDPSVPVEIDETSGRLTRLSNPKLLESLPGLVGVGRAGGGVVGSRDSGYYPLVNINKLRTYAKIVLKIIEFQNRSIRKITFETDSKWFLTCLKINCLQDDQLRSLSITCEPI